MGSTGVYWGAGPRDAFTGEAGQWGTGSDRAAAQRHRAGHGEMGCKEGARSSAPQWRSPPPPPHPPEHHGTKLQLSAHALYTGFIGSRKGQDMGWAAVTEGYPRALGTPQPTSHPDLSQLHGLVEVQEIVSFSFIFVCVFTEIQCLCTDYLQSSPLLHIIMG